MARPNIESPLPLATTLHTMKFFFRTKVKKSHEHASTGHDLCAKCDHLFGRRFRFSRLLAESGAGSIHLLQRRLGGCCIRRVRRGSRHASTHAGGVVGCGAQKLGPTENLFHVTLLHQFKELRSARWKSIDSKYVRAAWSFDEAQLSQRSNQAENLTSPLFMLLGLNFCAPQASTRKTSTAT